MDLLTYILTLKATNSVSRVLFLLLESCDEVYACPNATFSGDELIDYEFNEENSKWKMIMHLNFLDVFCP